MMNSKKSSGTFYMIRVQEKLDSRWEEWFNGMSITTDDEGTLLTGTLPDQAALHGIINMVHRLGLRLLAVVADKPGDAAETHESKGS